MTEASLVLPQTPGRCGEVLVREWQPADAQELNETIELSRQHLLPWMEFAGDPPVTLQARRDWIAAFSDRRRGGGDALYGIFLTGERPGAVRVAGACGLHRRLAPGGLEIGYWVHVDHIGKGLAATASAILTDAAFALAQISFVEIHHDQANERSRRIPEKLGYQLIAQEPDEVLAPGESGIECRWQMTREQWLSRASTAPRQPTA